MKTGEDIVAVSVPFAAGVGAAAVLQPGPAAGAACLGAAASCMAAMACRKGRNTALAALLFLLLGFFTWSAHSAFPRPEKGNSPFGSSPFGLTPPSLRDGPPASVPRVARPSGGVPVSGIAERSLEGLSGVIMRIPFPHGETNALLLALLTGRRERLDRATVQSFRSAGAAHILALSGLHLGIIYLILSKLLFFLGNSRTAWILRSTLVVGLSAWFTLMTGANPSTVRALLFIALAETARNCPGRRSSPVGIWCAALLIQLCLKPGIIVSAGFQLSYLAMLGIFLLYPVLKGWYPGSGSPAEGWDPVRRIWNSMALAISCQCFTSPLSWLRFHSFPQYFLLSNLIAMPLTGCLIAGGLACTALEAAAKSPRLLTQAVDWIAVALMRSLEIIAGM